MAGITPRLQKFLEEKGVEYERLHHRKDFTAQKAAEDTHTPPAEFAKTVFVCVDGSFAMAVLPATDQVSEQKLRLALDARAVELALEEETEDLCPDCEVGAAPPFGNLWDLPVYVSPSLAEDDVITFNAGTHEEAIRISYADYVRLVKPQVVPLGRHD